jgi:hypothetical protein
MVRAGLGPVEKSNGGGQSRGKKPAMNVALKLLHRPNSREPQLFFLAVVDKLKSDKLGMAVKS